MNTDSFPRPLRYLIEIALVSLVVFVIRHWFGLFEAFFFIQQEILIAVGGGVYFWIITFGLRFDIEGDEWLRKLSYGVWGFTGFIFAISLTVLMYRSIYRFFF
jgi:hypothetical protein|tara:strand:- start:255 stop:563 length:309 start_codon:yes stop_codon:yes gene_type:complete